MFKRRNYKKLEELSAHGHHHHNDVEGHGPPKDAMSRADVPGGVRLGVILNGRVMETIQANNQYAAMFLAQPTFVDITDKPDIVVGNEYPGE